ncbi:hypothetical protein NL676_010016 [Syzygium grande]|nr:hypothetical protein NL676_010016 [Syzygium grande]
MNDDFRHINFKNMESSVWSPLSLVGLGHLAPHRACVRSISVAVGWSSERDRGKERRPALAGRCLVHARLPRCGADVRSVGWPSRR